MRMESRRGLGRVVSPADGRKPVLPAQTAFVPQPCSCPFDELLVSTFRTRTLLTERLKHRTPSSSPTPPSGTRRCSLIAAVPVC